MVANYWLQHSCAFMLSCERAKRGSFGSGYLKIARYDIKQDFG